MKRLLGLAALVGALLAWTAPAGATSALVQEKYAVTTTTAVCAVTLTSNVTAGNTLVGFGFQGSGGVSSMADSVNGSYGAVKCTSGALSGRTLTLFAFPNAAAGSTTITGTTSSTFGCNIYVAEVSGVSTTSYQTCNTGAQLTSSGATDAITTGNVTPSSQPAFLVGLSHRLGACTVVTSSGTGYTAGTSGWPNGSNCSRAETKRVTSTSATAATFTNATDTGSQFSGVVVLTETVAGGGPLDYQGFIGQPMHAWRLDGHKLVPECATIPDARVDDVVRTGADRVTTWYGTKSDGVAVVSRGVFPGLVQ